MCYIPIPCDKSIKVLNQSCLFKAPQTDVVFIFVVFVVVVVVVDDDDNDDDDDN